MQREWRYLPDCVYISMNENEKKEMLKKLGEYFKNRNVYDHDAYREDIERGNEKSSKEDYVKSIAYETLFSGERFKGLLKNAKKELENNYTPERCFCELIQNIDDCDFAEDGGDATVSIEFDYEKNCIKLHYNEKGFEYRDVYGICSYGESTKNGVDENGNVELRKMKEISVGCYSLYKTGEKGVGFKAIYKIAKKVEIKSNGFYFALSADTPMVPEWLDASPEDQREGTSITVYLKDGEDIKELEKKLKKEYFCLNEDNSIGNVLVNNNILFTRNIRKITLKNTEKEYIIAIEKEKISPVDEDWNHLDKDLSNGEGIVFNGEKISSATYEFEFCVYEKENDEHTEREKQRIKLLKYVETVEVSKESCVKRYKVAKAQTRNISFITVAEDSEKNRESGCFYTTLPLEKKTKMPFSVDAPFLLNQVRSQIDMPYNDEILDWNIEIFNKVKSCFANFLLALRTNEKKICQIIGETTIKDSPEIKKENYQEGLENLWWVKENIQIFKTYQNNEIYTSYSDACFLESYFYDMPEVDKMADLIAPGKVLASQVYCDCDKLQFKKAKDVWDNWNSYVEKVENKEAIVNYLKEKANKFFKALPESETDRSTLCDKKIFLWEDEIRSEENLPFSPDELLVVGDGEKSTGCIYNVKELIPQWDFEKRAIFITKDELVDKLNESIKKYEEKYSKDSEDKIKEYYQAVLSGCREWRIEVEDLKKIEFSEAYKFKIDEDKYAPFLLPLENQPDDEVWKCFREKAKEEVAKKEKAKEEADKVSDYIVEKWIANPTADPNFVQQHLDGALQAILASKTVMEQQNSKLEITCSIEEILHAIDVYIEEQNKEIYKCFEKINNLLEIKIKNEGNKLYDKDGGNAIDNRSIEVIMKYCKKSEPYREKFEKTYISIRVNSSKYERFTYAFTNDTVYCLSENLDKSLSDYAEGATKKGELKARLNFYSKLGEIEDYIKAESGSKEKKKEFVEKLGELRDFQCDSGFDVDNIADQIVHSSNTWLEILQNINDARNEIKNDPNDSIEVKINKKEGFIELCYKERGFSYKDVKGITDLGNTEKDDNGEVTFTGEKGIGFKSVFQWAQNVEIHSNGFHFSIGKKGGFNKKDKKDIIKTCTIPEWIDERPEIYSDKTRIKLYLKKEENSDNKIDKIIEEIKKEDSYMCLDNCQKVILKFDGNESEFDLDKLRKEHYCYSVSLYEMIENENSRRVWMKKRKKWKCREGEKGDEYEKRLDEIAKKIEVQYYFVKKEESKEDWRDKTKKIKYYATLPLPIDDDEDINSIIINAPFDMDIARNIRIPSPYNKDLDEFIKGNFDKAITNAYRVENGNKIKFSDQEGEILFYLKGCKYKNCTDEGEKENGQIILDYIKDLKLFTCWVKQDERWIKDKMALNDILYIGCPEIYDLIEKLESESFKASIPRKAEVKSEELLPKLLDGIIAMAGKPDAILVKTKNIYHYTIEEIELDRKDNEAISISCIRKWFENVLQDSYELPETEDDSDSFVKFFKNLWKSIFESLPEGEGKKNCPIYPYIIEEGKRRFSKIADVDWYYYLDNNVVNSAGYYRIIDLLWIDKNCLKGSETEEEIKIKKRVRDYLYGAGMTEIIKEFGKKVIIEHLKKKLDSVEAYSDYFWGILREIYDLQKEG